MRHQPLWPLLGAIGAALLLLLLALLSQHLPGRVDLTAAGRHGVPPEIPPLLAQLPGTVTLTALLSEDNPARETVQRVFDRYAAAGGQWQLKFIAPETIPDAIRRGERHPGELFLTLGEREERLRSLDDAGMGSALLSLGRGGEPWVVVLTGHGERRARREANHDLSLLTATLEARGFPVAEAPADRPLPTNTRVAVLASPRVALRPEAIAALAAWLADGGALLLLLDPDDASVLPALGLPVARLPGTVVDPASQFRQIDDPSFVVLDAPRSHAALAGFDLPVLLPRSAALTATGSGDWQAEPLLLSNGQSWAEREPLLGQVGFDADRGDTRGPLTLALSLSRPAPDGGEQRVVVVGDGDFAANAYLANGGNRALAVALIEWLSAQRFAVSELPEDARYPVLATGGQHPLAYLGAAFAAIVLPLLLLWRALRLARR